MSFANDIRQKAGVIWHTQRIKRLVREVLGLSPQTLVSVTEIMCDDPACPGLATQITIMGVGFVRYFTVIHRPAIEVTSADLEGLRM